MKDAGTAPPNNRYAYRAEPPDDYRRRARRRKNARRMRRVESALAGWQVGTQLSYARDSVSRLHGSGWTRSKVLSAIVLVAALALLVMVHTEDRWFVYAEDVQFRNLQRLDAEQLYAQSGVDGWNIFWLRPAEVRARLLANPYIVDAQVALGLPGKLTVTVTEKQPVALWVTNRGSYWVTDDGAALPAAEDAESDLPQIVDTLVEAQSVKFPERVTMDPDALHSALALMATMPALHNQVRYNKDYGLNFPMPDRPVWVYWGGGENTERKLENLAAARRVLDQEGVEAQVVDVRFERPYIR